MKNIFIAAVLITFLFSCTNTKNEEKEECVEKTICTDTTAETTCPFLTTDNNGNIVMSYIKEKNDTLAVICYAISTDKGYSFGEPIEIPASKDVHPSAENLPKMAFKPNGEIIAVWGVDNGNPKKKYAGLVYYAQSFDEGKNWSEAKQLVEDTTSIDQRYFDISVLQNGEAGIIWLDSRTKTTKRVQHFIMQKQMVKMDFKMKNQLLKPSVNAAVPIYLWIAKVLSMQHIAI